MQELKTVLESVDNLLEELSRTEKTITRDGRMVKKSKKQLKGKKAGYRWDAKKGMYVMQTGTEKTRHAKAARKRALTMNTGKAERARKSKIRKRERDKAKRRHNVD